MQSNILNPRWKFIKFNLFHSVQFKKKKVCSKSGFCFFFFKEPVTFRSLFLVDIFTVRSIFPLKLYFKQYHYASKIEK